MPFSTIVGVDWAATDESKCGLCLATVTDGILVVDELLTGREAPTRRSAPLVANWLCAHPHALLAIDAPLGWPSNLARAIKSHVAGAPLGAMSASGTFFTRETDRFIKRTLGKKPLEVGADRIARTAFSALAFVAELRVLTSLPLALSWAAADAGIIEVYPAATLKSLSAPSTVAPYKKPEQVDARRSIAHLLASHATLSPAHVEAAIASDHKLDAVLCALAGHDFIVSRAVGPSADAMDMARAEGWIWARAPREAI